MVLAEGVGHHAVLVHHVGGENQAARLGHPPRLGEGRELVLVAVQVVEGAEEEGDVETAVRKEMQVPRVARPAVDVLVPGLQRGEVPPHQLHGGHGMSLPGKRHGVRPRPRPQVEYAELLPWRDEVVDVFHADAEFDLPVPGLEPVPLVEFLVISLKRGHLDRKAGEIKTGEKSPVLRAYREFRFAP